MAVHVAIIGIRHFSGCVADHHEPYRIRQCYRVLTGTRGKDPLAAAVG